MMVMHVRVVGDVAVVVRVQGRLGVRLQLALGSVLGVKIFRIV